MNCDVVVTAEDFKTIHNTLWELEYQGLSGRVGAERIRSALKSAYAQDHAAFERKHDYFAAVQAGAKLKSIWSIYKVEDFGQQHPYHCADTMVYTDHWGNKPVEEPILGKTWADLYSAADRCIQRSGDGHHVFIEGFEFVTSNKLRLTTGS